MPQIQKISIFYKIWIYCTLFIFFHPFAKKWVRKHIFYLRLFFRPQNTHLKPKKYHFLKFWKKWPKNHQIPLLLSSKFLTRCNFFEVDQFGWYLWTKRPEHIPFRPIKCFFDKRIKRGTDRNFCKVCPKLKKSQFFVKLLIYCTLFLPFW